MKRKLDVDFEDYRKLSSPEVRTQVDIIESTFSSTEADRASAKRAIHVFFELAKNGKTQSLVSLFIYTGSVIFSFYRHFSAYRELIQLIF